MAIEIRVPRLGWSMEEGTFLGWIQRSGDTIEVGDPLFELEGEKASQEIESVDRGILFIPEWSPKGGVMVPVGGLIGYLLALGESPPSDHPIPHDGNVPLDASSAIAAGSHESESPEEASTTIGHLNADGSMESRSKFITPRAKKRAQRFGLDWQLIEGTGRDGRVRERDIVGHLERSGSSAKPARDSSQLLRLAGRRKAIALRMRLSHAHVVPVTLYARVDITSFVIQRQAWKRSGEMSVVPSVTELAVRAAGVVLAQHPILASQWLSEEELELPDMNQLGIGVAVDVPDRLVVPVLRNPHLLSLSELSIESRSMIERARQGKLKQVDFDGCRFSISNLGGMGVDAFTPIVPYPQVAILGLGAIRSEPVTMSQSESSHWITLCLTFDHCAVDGAPAARFLQELGRWMSRPDYG